MDTYSVYYQPGYDTTEHLLCSGLAREQAEEARDAVNSAGVTAGTGSTARIALDSEVAGRG